MYILGHFYWAQSGHFYSAATQNGVKYELIDLQVVRIVATNNYKLGNYMHPLLKKIIDIFSPIDKGTTLAKLNAIITNPLFSEQALGKVNSFFTQAIHECPTKNLHLKKFLLELQKTINQIC